MNYKKLAVYLLIVLVIFGIWYKNTRDTKRRLHEYARFANAYAGAAVVAELYRNEPDRFLRARDSVYKIYDFTAASIDQFQQSLKNREEDWSLVWDAVRLKTDSLAKYYVAHPVTHPIPDSLSIILPPAKK
ncbi:MAG: hypothetical protein PHR28_01860 [candidate division Zixibacteria bacterium]|nr:hypothetical protein [candidate division Zixibacteria bacterium]